MVCEIWQLEVMEKVGSMAEQPLGQVKQARSLF
jgi:hypothetical protein